jgi:uncharacterized RDD family membrane protein YckC
MVATAQGMKPNVGPQGNSKGSSKADAKAKANAEPAEATSMIARPAPSDLMPAEALPADFEALAPEAPMLDHAPTELPEHPELPDHPELELPAEESPEHLSDAGHQAVDNHSAIYDNAPPVEESTAGMQHPFVAESYEEPAGIGRRFLAYLIDSMVIGSIMLAIGFELQEHMEPATAKLAANVVFILGILAYQIGFTLEKGATLGKSLLRLHVVNTVTGEKPDLVPVILREFPGKAISSILGIGYFMAFFNPERRTLHDKLGDTRVVLRPSTVSRTQRSLRAVGALVVSFTVLGFGMKNAVSKKMDGMVNQLDARATAEAPKTPGAPAKSEAAITPANISMGGYEPGLGDRILKHAELGACEDEKKAIACIGLADTKAEGGDHPAEVYYLKRACSYANELACSKLLEFAKTENNPTLGIEIAQSICERGKASGCYSAAAFASLDRQFDAGIGFLKKAIAAGIGGNPAFQKKLVEDPDLANLRSDLRFAQLVTPEAPPAAAQIEAKLDYLGDHDRVSRFGSMTSGFELVAGPLPRGWIAPKFKGVKRFHGSLNLRSGKKLNFVLDQTNAVEHVAYVTAGANTDFRRSERLVSRKGAFPKDIAMNLTAADGTKRMHAIQFWFPIAFNKKHHRNTLNYINRSGRTAMVKVGASETHLTLVDRSNQGDYSDLSQVAVGVGNVVGSSAANAPFMIAGQAYRIASIDSIGSKLVLQKNSEAQAH